MPRKSNTKKILTIEEKIKELERERKQILENLYSNIGKLVIKEFDCSDEETLKKVISHLKEDAALYIESLEDQSVQEEVVTT